MDMHNALVGFAMTAMAGAATPIGGLLAVMLTRKNVTKMWAFGLGISAGVMIYLSIFDLLPEALALTQESDTKLSVPAFFVTGLIMTWIIDLATHRWAEQTETIDAVSLEPGKSLCETQNKARSAALTGGIVTSLAIALHNFPEGIATFITASSDITLGASVAIAIALHNLPEGFCVALPVFCSTENAKRAVLFALGAGLAEPIGALTAFLFLGRFITPQILGYLFSAVAGIMVYVAVDEIIPASRQLSRTHHCITGFAVGIALMAFLMAIIK